jgi:hypothetical protein
MLGRLTGCSRKTSPFEWADGMRCNMPWEVARPFIGLRPRSSIGRRSRRAQYEGSGTDSDVRPLLGEIDADPDSVSGVEPVR